MASSNYNRGNYFGAELSIQAFTTIENFGKMDKKKYLVDEIERLYCKTLKSINTVIFSWISKETTIRKIKLNLMIVNIFRTLIVVMIINSIHKILMIRDYDDNNSSDDNSEDDEPINIEDESTLLMTQAIVFAPGEGQSPVSLFDDYTEALSFIRIYGSKLIKKPEHITYQNWMKSEIMRSDRRCATILKLFFSALKLRMSKISSSINFCLRKNKTKSALIKAEDILDENKLKHIELKDNGFKFLSHDRGSPSFWEEKKRNVFALFRQIGPPNIFFTLSAAETK